VAVLVLACYRLLRSILKSRPQVRRCRTRCRHCGIFFLAHPPNAGRHDLRCPFGCRQAHRRRESTQRSVAYYRDEAGQMKKRIQNGQRTAAKRKASAAEVAEGRWSATLVEHVRMVASQIEGRRVSREEVLALLLRQHSLPRRAGSGDTGGRCDEHPP